MTTAICLYLHTLRDISSTAAADAAPHQMFTKQALTAERKRKLNQTRGVYNFYFA